MKTPDALLPALRQYQHNDCSGFVFGFEYKEVCKIVTVLQAKLKAAIVAIEQIVSMGPPDTGEDATLMREYAQAALKTAKEG